MFLSLSLNENDTDSIFFTQNGMISAQFSMWQLQRLSSIPSGLRPRDRIFKYEAVNSDPTLLEDIWIQRGVTLNGERDHPHSIVSAGLAMVLLELDDGRVLPPNIIGCILAMLCTRLLTHSWSDADGVLHQLDANTIAQNIAQAWYIAAVKGGGRIPGVKGIFTKRECLHKFVEAAVDRSSEEFYDILSDFGGIPDHPEYNNKALTAKKIFEHQGSPDWSALASMGGVQITYTRQQCLEKVIEGFEKDRQINTRCQALRAYFGLAHEGGGRILGHDWTRADCLRRAVEKPSERAFSRERALHAFAWVLYAAAGGGQVDPVTDWVKSSGIQPGMYSPVECVANALQVVNKETPFFRQNTQSYARAQLWLMIAECEEGSSGFSKAECLANAAIENPRGAVLMNRCPAGHPAVHAVIENAKNWTCDDEACALGFRHAFEDVEETAYCVICGWCVCHRRMTKCDP